MSNKAIVLTHYDLDGVGCAVLLKKAFGNRIDEFHNVGYNRITDKIQQLYFTNFNEDFDTIFVTDLHIEQKHVNVLDEKFENVIYIDHHETFPKPEFSDKWLVIKQYDKCATLLVYNYLTNKGIDLSEYKDFVTYVNDYDLWLHEYKEARVLNTWFWYKDKFFKFLDRFVENPNIPDEMYMFLKQEDEKRLSEFEKIGFIEIDLNNGEKVLYCPTQNPEITLFYPEYRFYILDSEKDYYKISLRSDISILEFFENLEDEDNITGGGHKYAGGVNFSSPLETFDVIELFINWLNEKVEK